jgi:hypothetical protein
MAGGGCNPRPFIGLKWCIILRRFGRTVTMSRNWCNNPRRRFSAFTVAVASGAAYNPTSPLPRSGPSHQPGRFPKVGLPCTQPARSLVRSSSRITARLRSGRIRRTGDRTAPAFLACKAALQLRLAFRFLFLHCLASTDPSSARKRTCRQFSHQSHRLQSGGTLPLTTPNAP